MATENGYWKLLAEILVEINKTILDLVFIIWKNTFTYN